MVAAKRKQELAAVSPERLAAEGVARLRIVRAPDGLQIRTQITGAKTIRTAAYPSKRFRHARYAEGATEIARIMREEVLVEHVDAVAQPLRIEALIDGAWHVHIPDFANLLSSGARVLGDLKRDWSDFRTADGRRQSFLGQLAADALGWRYVRGVLASESDRRRDNVETVQASRFVHVPDSAAAIALAALSKGPLPLGQFSNLLHPVNGRSMAYALMVRRVVEIDLEKPLGARSECRAVPPLPLGMPSIRR